MVQRRNGSRTPIRWAGPVPDQADPTGGRHAFDAEAALTPIFTTLRRGDWRRPRYPQGVVHRPFPDPMDRFDCDPQTAPIPVVPALYAIDPDRTYAPPPVDPYAGRAFVPEPSAPPPSSLETTTWWPALVPVDEYDPSPYEPIPHPASDDRARFGPSDRGTSGSGAWGRRPAGPGHDRRTYDPRGYDPTAYDPVTDTGRHHRRLAPAGW